MLKNIIKRILKIRLDQDKRMIMINLILFAMQKIVQKKFG